MINTPNRQAVTRLAPGNICAEAHVDAGLYGKLVTGTGQAETAMHRISVQLGIYSCISCRQTKCIISQNRDPITR
jgi:hypothetical protein